MNDQAKDINMNIPNNEPGQPPQPQPEQPEQPQPAQQPVPTTNIHSQEQTKLTFLMALTFILGIVAVISLVFALKLGGNPLNIDFSKFKGSSVQEQTQQETVEQMEEEITITGPTQFDPKKEVAELDNLNLDLIEEDYLDSSLEN